MQDIHYGNQISEAKMQNSVDLVVWLHPISVSPWDGYSKELITTAGLGRQQ